MEPTGIYALGCILYDIKADQSKLNENQVQKTNTDDNPVIQNPFSDSNLDQATHNLNINSNTNRYKKRRFIKS